MIKLPFIIISRHRYDTMVTEKSILIDVIREANKELFKYKTLVGGLRNGDEQMTKAVEKVFKT